MIETVSRIAQCHACWGMEVCSLEGLGFGVATLPPTGGPNGRGWNLVLFGAWGRCCGARVRCAGVQGLGLREQNRPVPSVVQGVARA